MERASRLIRRLKLPGDALSPEELIHTAWPVVVGRKIAAHARPGRMVRTRLLVEVEDNIWQRQLFALTRQIVANLDRHLGQGMVEDIEFRIVPRRMEPRRSPTSTPGSLMFDEADQIHDPVLRVIYKASRKKALA